MAEASKIVPMSATAANDAVQEQIHFETLWATVQNALAIYAGQRWSARDDADPGVTLLQALAFGVSDISYRHTLPLTDLLTSPQNDVPTSSIHLEHEGNLFAPEFGPERALTSSPVTMDDYRCAILDLSVGGLFCFRDVQISPLAHEESYRYAYDSDSYTFRFADQTPAKGLSLVAGQYRLWVTLAPGVKKKQAESVLSDFLKSHRNLCEWAITSPIFVPIKPSSPNIRLILADDLLSDQEAMCRAIAHAIWVINQTLLPMPVRMKALERLAQGETAEQIYLGPRLTHGWILRLPLARTASQGKLPAYSVSVQALSAAVTASVPGIDAVEWSDDQVIQVGEDSQTQLWVDKNGELVTVTDYVQLYRHGQRVPVAGAEIVAEYQRLDDTGNRCSEDARRSVPNGRHRDPGFYRTVGNSLPPVYGLQQPADALTARNDAGRLLQFLRPFEQLLANSADQLRKLPQVLAFDGRDPDAALWGAGQWPQQNADPLAYEQTNTVFKPETLEALTSFVSQQSRDNEKELAILDYLLGYFGEKRASRTLNAASQDIFRHVQQGFLRQITRLAYERAAISISRVSALQRKIAVRLGVGAELFDEKLQKKSAPFPSNPLPFYMIEHQELLPATPSSVIPFSTWSDAQKVEKVVISLDEKILTLSLAGEQVATLKPGMLIELQGTSSSQPTLLEPLVSIVIHEVSGQDVAIQLAQHTRLSHSIALLKDSGYTWQWRCATSWLKRVVYNAERSAAPTGKDSDTSVVLNVGPSFPNELTPGTRFALRPKGRWLSWPNESDLTGNGANKLPDVVVEVTAADPLRGTITVKWVSKVEGLIPDKPDMESIRKKGVPPVVLGIALGQEAPDWHVCLDPLQPYALSVPYGTDIFAFTLSLVLDRQWLAGRQSPEELHHWIVQMVREEMPSHLNLQVHWLDSTQFANFAAKYRQWQNDGLPVGDHSYELLRLLGIGERPVDERGGIGFSRIVSQTDSERIKNSMSNYDENVHDKALQREAVVYVRGSH